MTQLPPTIDARPDTYLIEGREVRLPVAVRDATAAVAYYLVPAGRAQRLIAPSGLRIATVLPGRTLCTIGTMVYRDGDLGTYHEVSVSFFVREPRRRALPVVGGALDMVRGHLGAYIHLLPVDGTFTCEAGCTIWGFPKFMSQIEVSERDGVHTSVLRVDGEHVLTQTMRTGGARGFDNRAQLSYAHRDGVTYRTPSVMSAAGLGARLRGAHLELGTHPLADELRSLRLPARALFSTYIGKMTGDFYAAEALETP
jgi:hypothetical protein